MARGEAQLPAEGRVTAENGEGAEVGGEEARDGGGGAGVHARTRQDDVAMGGGAGSGMMSRGAGSSMMGGGAGSSMVGGGAGSGMMGGGAGSSIMGGGAWSVGDVSLEQLMGVIRWCLKCAVEVGVTQDWWRGLGRWRRERERKMGR
ncbi:unnamed protein product [Closterium sp. Naga37s-1]|nr:unnamed protein product [Closterium sp. Naga37s-1]